MSKRTSKILIVAVVAILAISMISLVACGPKLDGKKGLTQLQEGFKAETNKKAVEKIHLGGLDVNLANLITVKVNGVDVELTRTYADKNMTIEAVIKNLDVEATGIDMLSSFLKDWAYDADGDPIDADGNKLPPDKGWNEKYHAKKAINLDGDVIKNLKKVSIEAKISMDDTMELHVYNFTIKGLDKVKDAGGKQLNVLMLGDHKTPIGAKYTPGELNPKEGEEYVTIDPYHEKSGEGDQDGLFYAMNTYADGAGDFLANYLKSNYMMVTPYEFKEIKVEDGTFSADAPVCLDSIFATAQQVLDKYKDNDAAKIELGGQKKTLGEILDGLVGTTNVKEVIGKLADLGNAKMSGTWEKSDNGVRPLTMKVDETIKITISQDLVGSILGLVGAGDDIKGLVNQVVKEDITASVKASVDATYSYEA